MSVAAPSGLLAEFVEADALLTAVRAARASGYERIDAFSPFPVEGLSAALGIGRPWIPLAMLAGGLAGAIGAYAMQYYLNVVEYPLNVGGRPLHSWPAFIPVTFEVAALFAALAGLVVMLLLSRLPRPHHPLFEVPGFERATRDRFFLLIQADDRRYDAIATRRFLDALQPERVSDVPL